MVSRVMGAVTVEGGEIYPGEVIGEAISGTKKFGFSAQIDNSQAALQLADYLATTSPKARQPIDLPCGDLWADKWVFPAEQTDGGSFSGLYGGCTLRGAGVRRTQLRANVSSEPIFFYNEPGGFNLGWTMSGISIIGNASNANQVVCQLSGAPKTFDDKTGGIRYLQWSDIYIGGGAQQQFVIKGGIIDALCPNDFWTLRNVNVERAANVHVPAWMVIGQYGQIEWINTRSGGAASNAGPNLYMGYHPSNTTFTPSSVASDVITCVAVHRTYTAQPVRFVGTTAPTGLAKGTTYFSVPQTKTTDLTKVGVAATPALAYAGTLVTVTGAGSCIGVKLWATDLTSNAYTTEYQHLMTTGDPVRLWGINLPTVGGSGITSGDQYWAIVTSPFKFKLASSLANAKAQTATTTTGGTLNDYGFAVRLGDNSSGYSSFQPDLRMHTSEGAETGAHFQGVQGVMLLPYFESLTYGFEVYGTIDGFVGMPGVNVTGGRFATVTNVMISESAGVLTSFDADRICNLSGGGFYPLSSSTCMIANNKQQSVAFSATPTFNWRTGAIGTLGALTSNVTAVTVSNIPTGQRGKLLFVQDGTGTRTVTLGSGWKGPTLSSGTASQKLMVDYYYDGTDKIYTSSGWL